LKNTLAKLCEPQEGSEQPADFGEESKSSALDRNEQWSN